MGRRGRRGTGDVEPARVGPVLGVRYLRRRLRNAERGEGAVEDQSVGARGRRPSAEDLILPIVPGRDDAGQPEWGPTSRLDGEPRPRGELASFGGTNPDRDLGIENGGPRPRDFPSRLASGAGRIDERPPLGDGPLLEQQGGLGRGGAGGAGHVRAPDGVGGFAPGG